MWIFSGNVNVASKLHPHNKQAKLDQVNAEIATKETKISKLSFLKKEAIVDQEYQSKLGLAKSKANEASFCPLLQYQSPFAY